MFRRRCQTPIKRWIARVLTYVGHPSLVSTMAIIALAYRFCEPPLALRLSIVAALTILVIPTIYTAILLKLGKISDPLFTVRAERRLLFLPMGIILVAGFFTMQIMGAPKIMISIGACGATGLAVAAIITRFWKISLHAGGLSGIAALALLVWPPSAIFAIPFVVGVCWSRVALKEHTPAQVIAGSLLGFILTLVITVLFMNT